MNEDVIHSKSIPEGLRISAETSFSIIDECDDWIVVNKPAPLVVHPTNNRDEPTLLGGLDALLSFDLVNGAKLGIINRLDRETSGVVIVTKNTPAARMLSRAIERREVTKTYRAIVFGWPESNRFNIDEPILRQGQVRNSTVWVKQTVHQDGRECQTSVQVLRRFEKDGRRFSELRVTPRTGRMHQIRVHLAWAGYPIIGDKLYGPSEKWYLLFMANGWSSEMLKALCMKRQALHAERMNFVELGLVWEAPLPNDMSEF